MKQTFVVIMLTILVCGCTKHFDEINKNPYDFNEEELKPDFKLLGEPLVQVMLNYVVVEDPYRAQVTQNLLGDVYAGYMMCPQPFEDNRNNTTYVLLDKWTNLLWERTYGYIMANCNYVMERAGREYADFYAWAQILRVIGMHRISDIYGPVIYTKYKQINSDHSIDYDSQQEAYYAFFKDLDGAIRVLEGYANTTQQHFKKFDLAYDGDYRKWIKLANTLRLRLAIRISGVDPVKAKTEGEAALRHPLGILSATDENFSINTAPLSHPLNVIGHTWDDTRMGAPMESILTGYNDPRLPKYFEYSKLEDRVYHGIRNGISITSKETYEGFSQLAVLPNRIQFLTTAEAWFLKAEAALYGWNGAGDVRSNYEAGIRASFEQYGLLPYFNSYIADHTAIPKPYRDPLNSVNNVSTGDENLSTITIRWENDDTPARKLERIITQKWIAMFPEGQEAWSEFRRTGYPRLFPVVVNNSGNLISTKDFIRRVNFARSEYTTNPLGVARAVRMLKGPDNGGTRLWWDQR
ncbi:SusD/RagB family nutrient-binding outer membrane lipoprotein [Chitinophaga pendula]|uniref:SusD/RagB family nutrient-binding outer membrane lipoprotein n=1 Tax=Chitinophaga TaxID=79328 RepID=UPI000BB0262A|nr:MULTISPECIES: SusD/RagB family nutrient-binding outer membrane lipoprotein [Chitinophaga]ASZ11486.1 SusD/RagB family nutrient-binding outer membrane lipoprotein [Chitinophaga sp. MD30]UCJ05504.1 SusD/RagB family nutrient-binding outer membrane lipoprotein [Chitinophaga pendula]